MVQPLRTAVLIRVEAPDNELVRIWSSLSIGDCLTGEFSMGKLSR